MICSHCQKEIAEYSNYCYYCGAPQRLAPVRRNLMRSITNRRIAGVCGGIGEYLDTDPTIVRLAWFLSVFVPPLTLAAILGYLIAWIIVPVAPHPAA